MTETLTHELPVGYVLESKFRILNSLGQGAFGATYLVKHIHFDTYNVVKEYLPQSAIRTKGHTVSPKSQGDIESFNWGLKRFYDEAKLLYKLSHPNIVKVIDLFQANGTAYFVMPYLGGNTFQNWIDYHPTPTEDELLAIFIPILEGLNYIHSQGLLHRDIKPDNILITDDSTPVLIDFGSARNAIGIRSQLLTRVLTPHFAPIEQYSQSNEHTYSPALDLYSVSTCIYQAIVGDYPPAAIDRVNEDVIVKLEHVAKFKDRYSTHFLRAIDKNLSLYAKDRDLTGSDMQDGLLGFNENKSEPITEITAKNKAIEEKEAYRKAREIHTIESYNEFINEYPYGETAKFAQLYIDELIADDINLNTKDVYEPNVNIETNLSEKPLEINSVEQKTYQLNEPIFFSTKGRIGRLRYTAYNGMLVTIEVLAFTFFILSNEIDQTFSKIALYSFCIVSIFFTIMQCIVIARRLHDLNKSAWFMLFPFIGIYAYFAKGTEGKNKYGLPDNLNNKMSLIIWALSPLISFLLLGIVLYTSNIV